MITRLYVNNFRSLVNFEIHFGARTLLLGRNGSGKSSVLEVLEGLLRFLDPASRVNVEEAFPRESLTAWMTSQHRTLELDVEIGGANHAYRLEVVHGEDHPIGKVAKESLSRGGVLLFSSADGVASLRRDDGTEGLQTTIDWRASGVASLPRRRDNKVAFAFLDELAKVVAVQPVAPLMENEARTEDTRLRRNASNFVAWLRHISHARIGAASELLESLRETISAFQRFDLLPTGRNAKALVSEFLAGDKTYRLDFDRLSDGERALFLLYSLLHFSAEKSSTLVLDEPDNFLALAEIQPWLRAFDELAAEKGAQLILISHHPEVINFFGVENSVWLEREEGGPTRVRTDFDVESAGRLTLAELVARNWVP